MSSMGTDPRCPLERFPLCDRCASVVNLFAVHHRVKEGEEARSAHETKGADAVGQAESEI